MAKHRWNLIVFEDMHWIDPTSLEALSGRNDRIMWSACC